MANTIVHAEVTGKDAPKLQKFFSEVFDWKLNTDLPGGYGMSNPADSGIVFGVGPSPDGGAGLVTFYVWVPSIDDVLAKATARGGTVIMPKFSPAPGNTVALFADPEGHIVGLSE